MTYLPQSNRRAVCLLLLLLTAWSLLYSQSTSSGGGGGSLAGYTYPRAVWDNQLSTLPPPGTFGLKPSDYASVWDFFDKDSYRKDVLIYCYRLEPALGAGQPFALVPDPAAALNPPPPHRQDYLARMRHGQRVADTDQDGLSSPHQIKKYEMCANRNPYRALVMNRFLVFRIDMSSPAISNEMRDRIQALNINVSAPAATSLNSQRGPALNPTVTRPSLAALSSPYVPPSADVVRKLLPYRLANQPFIDALRKPSCSPSDSGDSVSRSSLCDVYYLTWPVELVGDTTPTVSINLIYTPVAPGKPWEKSTFYPAGSIVTGASGNATLHFYAADNSGVSSSSSLDFNNGIVSLSTVDESDSSGLKWAYVGEVSVTPTPSEWQKNTSYPANALVTADPANGHFYMAEGSGGRSGTLPPEFPIDGRAVTELLAKNKKGVTWRDMGLSSINPTPPVWAASTAYAREALVTPPQPNGYYYRAVTAGVSGANSPAFPTPPFQSSDRTVAESAGVAWTDVGATLPSGAKFRVWTKNTAYYLGDVIQDPWSGHYYSATSPGISGKAGPPFEAPKTQTVDDQGGVAIAANQMYRTPIVWRDLGTSLPSPVTAGSQPADQSVSVLNLTLPQIQVLGRFNLTSGGVFNWLKPPSISQCVVAASTNNVGSGGGTSDAASSGGGSNTGGSGGSTTTPCPASAPSICTSSTPCYVSTPGSRFFDPIMAVSVYAFKPLDAERSFKLSDLMPAPTFGFSLQNPTDHFYLGGSSEALLRNLQFVYGVSFIQMASLQNPTTLMAGMQYSNTEKTGFRHDGFAGITFNITGFVQSLFPIP